MADIVNCNKVEFDGTWWVVKSADGSWDGYELYDTKEEALEAANRPDEEE